MSTGRLSAADMEILEFERTGWASGPRQGPKATAVRERFGFAGGDVLTAYYLHLNRIISDPAAVVYDPELVNRLRRIRDQRQACRDNLKRGAL